MKKTTFLPLFLLLSINLYSQDIEIYGFENTGNAGCLKLVSIDPIIYKALSPSF